MTSFNSCAQNQELNQAEKCVAVKHDFAKISDIGDDFGVGLLEMVGYCLIAPRK